MKKLSYIPVLFMVLLAKSIPFNWIIGSYHATFSWTTMLAPALTKYYGFAWILLFFVSPSLIFAKAGIHSIFFSLLHRTPLLFASRTYHVRHWSTSFALPALCMILFVIHDVGSIAWCYSLFWLIPMMLYFAKDSMVTRALSASFLAHGVGSVIWLYTKIIPAEVWISLIPIVICERLLMAGGMMVLDVAINRVRRMQRWTRFCKTLGCA